MKKLISLRSPERLNPTAACLNLKQLMLLLWVSILMPIFTIAQTTSETKKVSENTSSQAVKKVAVEGRILDITQKAPLYGVSVLSKSGSFAISDTLGFYKIICDPGDSIWFSYQGKETPKYAVDKLSHPLGFDLSLQVKSDLLPPVTIWKPNYKLDSMRNREEYAKIFGYKKPGFSTSTINPNSGTAGVGVDLGELINLFRFKRTKRLLSLQERLLQEEEDKYIEFRFSKIYIRKLTDLNGEELNKFFNLYKPHVEFVKLVSEAEMGIYIQQCFKDYRLGGREPKERIQLRVLQYNY